MPTRSTATMPEFIEPMLASAGEPFDDDRWQFEIKWDGFRAICRRDDAGCRLFGRRGTDFTSQFPELIKALSALPPGTIVDGEIVAMVGGKPDFTALLRRGKNRRAVVQYVGFDLLYRQYRPLLKRPLVDRREQLQPILKELSSPRIGYSDGVVGRGTSYFQIATAQGLEGVMAKRLASTYHPGVRCDDWIKIKRRSTAVCVVIGYVTEDGRTLRSLIIATQFDGEMKCVGKVGSGISPTVGAELMTSLKKLQRRTPAIPCKLKGNWVEPELFCRVSYAEVLESGNYRAPVFEELIKLS